jgi:hypothetical protein
MALSRITLITFRVALALALAVTMYLATTQQEFPVIDDINDKVTQKTWVSDTENLGQRGIVTNIRKNSSLTQISVC